MTALAHLGMSQDGIDELVNLEISSLSKQNSQEPTAAFWKIESATNTKALKL